MQVKSSYTFQRFGGSLKKGNDCLWDSDKGERRWPQKTHMEMGERMWKEGSCLIAFVWKVDGIFCTVRFWMCVLWCAESFQFSWSVVSNSLWTHEPQHTRLPCPSPAPRVHPNPCPLSQWCHPTISSSAIPFSSCLQSFPASGQFLASGGQSIGASASASVLPINIQDWFPLGWTGWISLQSKGLSKVFSNTNFCIYNCTSPSVWSSLTSGVWHSYPTYWVDIRIQAYTYMRNVTK